MRLGRIGYINCYPVYGAIDRGITPLAADLVTGTPSELNDLLAAGELDLSVVSAVEYARNARDYVLLPNLAISCDGPVRSVALFSRRPVGRLDDRTVLLTASSRTAAGLLELLCRDVWKVRPHFAQARAEAPDLDALAHLPHEAVLVIGDAALLLAARHAYPHRYDLGEEWKRWPRAARPMPRPCATSTRPYSRRAPGGSPTSTNSPLPRLGRATWNVQRASSI
jgi:chorismate dehydratase